MMEAMCMGSFGMGGAPTLRDQVLQPIQDELEMNASLEEAMAKLEAMSKYRDPIYAGFWH